MAVGGWQRRDAAGVGGEEKEMEKDERTRKKKKNKEIIKKVYLNEVL